MDITLHLILAHFLADYPLQSNRLVAYKSKHFAGVLLHSLTHVATSILLGLPFILQGRFWLAVLFVFLTHNLIDQAKLWTQRRFRKVNAFLFYLVDQMAHLVIIVASSNWWLKNLLPDFGGAWFSAYSNKALVGFLLALILATYFYDVSRWTYINALKPQPYVRDWKGMVRNALIVVVGFGVYWVVR